MELLVTYSIFFLLWTFVSLWVHLIIVFGAFEFFALIDGRARCGIRLLQFHSRYIYSQDRVFAVIHQQAKDLPWIQAQGFVVVYWVVFSAHEGSFMLTYSYELNYLYSRATEAGDYNIVSQLLACGYRSRDAKNQDGQTAVHLAARAGRDNILAKLIESGATVNVRDSFGYTPLHVSNNIRYIYLSL